MTKDLSDNNCYCLTIDSASAEDEGSYSVVASNEVNQCTDFCNVRVKRPPKIVKNMERDVQVFAGEDAVFQIEVSEKPAPNVKWYALSKREKRFWQNFIFLKNQDLFKIFKNRYKILNFKFLIFENQTSEDDFEIAI